MKHRVCLILAALSVSSALTAKPVTLHYEGVIGTSMDVSVTGSNESKVTAASEKVMAHIQKMENVLSTWKPDSDISRLNDNKKLAVKEQALLDVLRYCQQWAKKTQDQFSCKLGTLKQAWYSAFKNKEVPDRVAMRYMAKDIQESSFSLKDNVATLDDQLELDIAGLAKGYILDQALKAFQRHLPNAKGIQLNIGGDLVMWSQDQHPPWTVTLADPFAPVDNQPLVKLKVPSGAIAASGHVSRGYQFDNRFFSHIFTPKDGWPLDNAPAAIVYAKDAVSADAAATSLSTQPITAGLDWINQQADMEALIIAPNGIRLASDGWTKLVDSSAAMSAEPLLNISYKIPVIEADKYHRPYLSIWVTDENNRSVRNLILLGETERWAKKNSRWWRKIGRRNPDLLDSLARPTRRPGQYNLTWDGLDDFGKPVKKAKYWLHFEASREAGGHDYQKIQIDLNQSSISQALNAKGELGPATLNGSTQLASQHSQ